uniref:Chromo domain-containing protein n=1 Tax=Strongyloides venezuelensis TaxID=75913 RepID=A0A0K0F4Z9_STRVS
MNEITRSITRIFDKRTVNNKVEYMVAFKGLHIGLSEWVPVEELKECQNEIDYYEAKIKGIKKPDRILQFSKFANDYEFIRLRNVMPEKDYKEYQLKDEYESDSDYEEFKIDYREALKQMELEEEKKQLYGEDTSSTSNFQGINRSQKSKDNSKVKIILSNGNESEGYGVDNENGSACDGNDKDSYFDIFTSTSESDGDEFAFCESGNRFLGFMAPRKPVSHKKMSACNGFDNEMDDGTSSIKSESADEAPVYNESDRESPVIILSTINDSAKNSSVCNEYDKKSICNKLPTANDYVRNTPVSGESGNKNLFNKLPTVNKSAKNTPVRGESDKESLINKLPTINESSKTTPARGESDKESLDKKSSSTYESAKDTPVSGEPDKKCLFVGLTTIVESTKNASVCSEFDKQNLGSRISTTNKSAKSPSVYDGFGEEILGSEESTTNESAKDTSDCEESDGEDEDASKSPTINESMFVSVSSGIEVEEPVKDGPEVNVPGIVKEPVCPRMTRSSSRRQSRKLSSSSEANNIDTRETSTTSSCTSTRRSNLRGRRSTRNSSRINVNESDSDDQIGDIKKQKTFIEAYVKPMTFSYIVEEDNFLTFVETCGLQGRKFVIYLTKDGQYLMVDEKQVPSALLDQYFDFLEKKGIPYLP